MNEPSNFVTGSIYGCTTGKLDIPPYVPREYDSTVATVNMALISKRDLLIVDACFKDSACST